MKKFDELLKIVRRLRKDCPWDREQTFETMKPFLLEEVNEVIEAIDEKDYRHLAEELGDMLLHIVMLAVFAEQAKKFKIEDVINSISAKMIRRHPHVFGGERLDTPEEVVGEWEKTKSREKPKESALDGVPSALPALQRSLRVIEKVSKVGFQWPDLKGPLEKVSEELSEIKNELEKHGGSITRESTAKLPEEIRRKLEAELGDLLFTVSNLAHFLHLNPEDSLRSMLARFERRFRFVEKGAKDQGKELECMSLEEMDLLWVEAKIAEKSEH